MYRRGSHGRPGASRLVRTGSEVGVDEGGCSPTRARARCACRPSRISRQQTHRCLPQSRQRRAAGVADHDAGRSRAWRCAPLAISVTLVKAGSSRAFAVARVSRANADAWLRLSAGTHAVRAESVAGLREKQLPDADRPCACTKRGEFAMVMSAHVGPDTGLPASAQGLGLTAISGRAAKPSTPVRVLDFAPATVCSRAQHGEISR